VNGYADTGFLASLFLQEATSASAENALLGQAAPLPIPPLTLLELRNALNLAVARKQISLGDRDALWRQFEVQIRAGVFVQTPLPSAELHEKARDLSDRYTPALATRSLDLLHVAAALLLNAKVFYSFDERQRQAAAAEGLQVKP
jgi:predicted nucleic acid-binding protein